MQTAPPSDSQLAPAAAQTAATAAAPHAPAAARPGRAFLGANLVRLASLVVVLLAWEQYGKSVNPILFTYPTAIAAAFAELTLSGELWTYLQLSLKVILAGLFFGAAVGVPVGVLMARSRLFEHATDMYVSALYATPMVALVPLLILWFGIDERAKIIIIFLFAVFPILINTYQGVKNVDPRLLEVARSFVSKEHELWVDVVIPSAIPFIIAGLRLAVGRALVGAVVADFLTSISGLGYMIVKYSNSFQTAKLFVPVIVLMMLGVVLMEGLKLLQIRLAPWTNQTEE
jgi:ABC-type nitrate/sulfonate/bicarbonate transport system permease component